MNKNFKIVIPLLSITSLLLLSSVSISLAWYASGAFVSIDNMYVSLASDPSLNLGIKNENNEIIYYKDEVPSSVIRNSVKKDYVLDESKTNEFEPVSSMFNKEFIASKESNPIFYSRYMKANKNDESTFKKTKIATNGYFELEFYLESDSNIFVTLDKSSFISSNKEINHKKSKELTKSYLNLSESEIEENLNNIEKSLRISLLEDSDDYKFNIIDPFKEDITYFAGTLDLNNDHYYDSYIASDNKKKEFLFGEYYNEESIKYNNIEKEENITNYSTFNAKHEINSYSIDLNSSIEEGLELGKENSIKLSDVINNDEFIALYAFTPKRFVLDIYIEGWDKDNVTLCEFGAFTSLIKFKVTKENIL